MTLSTKLRPLNSLRPGDRFLSGKRTFVVVDVSQLIEDVDPANIYFCDSRYKRLFYTRRFAGLVRVAVDTRSLESPITLTFSA